MADRIRVALTGFAGLDTPEPGTGVAQALRKGSRGNLEIVALGYDTWQTGAWLPGLVDQIVVLPPLASGVYSILEKILEIHEKTPLDALIPNLDLEVPLFTRLKPQLEKAGIQTLLPTQESDFSINKTSLARFCYTHDILSPNTVHVTDLEEIPMRADHMGYPLMVKGSVAGAAKVDNSDLAQLEATVLHAKWGGGVLLQNCIDGDEYVVAMVARVDGSCLGMTPARKLGTNKFGKAVVGSVVNAPDLEKTSLEILAKLNWRGPLELEFIRSRVSGQYYLIEINNRFPSWIMLSAYAGSNLPVALLKEILNPGQRRCQKPKVGTSFVRDVRDFAVSSAKLRELERHGNIEITTQPNRTRRNRKRKGAVVGVTGISAFEEVLAGCGVAESLRRVPEVSCLIGLVYGPFDTAAYRNNTFDVIQQLPGKDDADKLLDRLLSIRAKSGLDVIIPCVDFEIRRFFDIREALENENIKVVLPSQKAFEARSKERLFLKKVNRDWGPLQIPQATTLRKKGDLKIAMENQGFPLTLKCETSSVHVTLNAHHALSVFRQLRDDGHESIVAQPFVHGEEYSFSAICADDHSVVEGVLIKKLCKNETGKTWGATCVDNPYLQDSLSEFLKHLKWTGPVEIEMIRDFQNDRFVMIEVNPRFPAWISFTRSLGINLPQMALRMALELDNRSPRQIDRDRIFMRSCTTPPADPMDFAEIATRGILNHGS